MARNKTALYTPVTRDGKIVKTLAAVAACSLLSCTFLEELHEAPSDPPGSLIDAGAPDAVNPPCAPVVNRFKELVIVDPSVVDDPARSAPGGAWSFKHLIDQMRPETTTPSDFVEAWLADYKVSEVNGFPVLVRSGVDTLLAAWPKTTDGELDLDRAPFKLIAITNRLDLRDKRRMDSAGEGRLVFAGLVNGVPASLTVIFEYLLPTESGKTPRAWANTWHSLGTLPSGETYNRALESLTRSFTDRNAAPGRTNGSALGQVRSNEIQFASPWELREFHLDGSGALRIAPTHNCPDQIFNGSAQLVSFVREHEDEIRARTHQIPTEMLGGSCPETPANVWRLPGVDESLRKAFAMETCNGCHSAETASRNGFYHITPTGAGIGRLSRFLHNPDDTTRDELSRRSAELSALLCSAFEN